MIVCHPSLSGVGGRFIGTMSAADGNGGDGDSSGSGTTSFGTFLFHTTGSGILIAFSD